MNKLISGSLRRLVAFDERHGPWSFRDVADIVNTALIKRFIAMGFIRPVGGGKVNPLYRVTDKARNLYGPSVVPAENDDDITICSSLFDGIVGLDDIKELIFMMLAASAPVHLFIIGSPSSAKSALLYSLEKLPRSVYVDGSMSTKTGIGEVLEQYMPRYLLIDEFDKLNTEDYKVLLTVMSEGRYVKTKSHARVNIPMETWVFAVGNTYHGVPDSILKRFLTVVELPEYDRLDSLHVMETVLTHDTTVNPELASYISTSVVNTLGVRNPRVAIQIARMAKSKEDVDRIIDTMRRY